MYCSNCGSYVEDNLIYCMNCGAQVKFTEKESENDKSSFGFAALGFFIPIVGLILYIIYYKERPLRAKSVGIGAIIGFVLHFVLAVVISLFTYFLSFSLFNTLLDGIDNNITAHQAVESCTDVKFGEFTAEYSGYALETFVDVTVTNTDDERHSLWIKIEAFSPNGTRIDTDTLYVDELNPSQSALLRGFTNASDEKIALLENADFRVIDITAY